MLGLIIIASMIVFGGLIAFLGDRVGMKVGKKRLSLFGLRPKYTSMIITVLTGFFIAGLTLVILTFISEYARTAIFRLQTIEHELKTATGKVKQLTAQITQKEQEYNTLHQNLLKAIAQQSAVEKQLAKTRTQYRTVSSNLKSTKEDLSLAQNRLTNLTKINDDLKNQISNLTLQETRLSQQIQNLEGWLQSEQDQNRKFIDKPVIFYVGEILGTRIINPGLSSNQIFDMVVNDLLLKEVNPVALKRGGRLPGKVDYALRVDPKKITEVSTALAKIQGKAVLRVVVEKNSVVEEPVTVTLQYYLNEVIFKANEVIASTMVSSDDPESELRDHLLSLLIVANNKAIEKGIITDGQNLRNIISIHEIAKMISEIRGKKSGNQYQVCLMAINDIYRVDPFKVKFVLKSLEE